MLSSFLPGRPHRWERPHPRIIVEHLRLDTQRGRNTCQPECKPIESD
jgi:hypothetical protein